MNAPARDITPAHNKPALITTDQLARDFGYLVLDIAALDARVKSAPTVVEDEDDVSTLRGIGTEIMRLQKRREVIRTETKEPYLTAGRVVDNYFGELETQLKNLLSTCATRVNVYQQRLAAEEKARREEEARKQREAAAEAQRKADEERRKAEEERRRIEAEQRAAEEKRKAEEAAREAERKRQEDERQAEIEKAGAEEKARLEAEAKRKAEEEAKQRREEEERRQAEQAKADAEARERQEEAEAAASRARREAEAAAAAAAEATRAAEAKPADLGGRIRTTGGGMVTLAEEWDFEIIEPTDVDVSEFASFIPDSDREKAIRRFVATHKGTRTLKGVRIFPKTKTQFR